MLEASFVQQTQVRGSRSSQTRVPNSSPRNQMQNVLGSKLTIAVQPGTPRLVLQYPATIRQVDSASQSSKQRASVGQGLFGKISGLSPLTLVGVGVLIGKYILR